MTDALQTPADEKGPEQFSAVRPRDIFDKDEIASLRQRNNWRAAGLFIHAWVVIGASMALFALFPNPLTFLIAVVLIGARQLGLAILMHDGAHGLLFSNVKVNDFVTQWFASFPIATDIRPYRPYHLTHHKNTQQESDPDLILSAPFPITRESLRRKIMRDLTGQTGYKQRKSQIKAALGKPGAPFKDRLSTFIAKFGGPLATNLVLLTILSGLGYWYLYPLLWVLPLLTWYQMITRLRNICEHAMVPDNNDPMRNARTTYAGWFMKAMIAPYWVNYHVEHHLFTWIPCYNLAKAHELLLYKGYRDQLEIQPSYWAVLKIATGADQDGDNKRDTPAENLFINA